MTGLISDADLQRVREATDIVALIRESVPLKRSGSSFKALCPFHQEKTPSFIVTPSKQIFKCFGCGAAGDVFSFVMKHDRIEFAEAVRALARRAGVSITETTVEKQSRTSKDRLYDANKWAARFYFEQLEKSADAAHAREYVEKRRIAPEMVTKFRLGYSPNRWDSLVTKAKDERLDLQLLAEAGLVVRKKEGGYYDFFRNRLMFPIFDVNDRVIGFGGRSLDGSEPKYINSSESAVFSKGRSLYGVSQAMRAMQKEGRVVVVEGYTDVIMAHQYGFEPVVAVLGTALTQDHVRLLRRFAAKAVLLLDQDQAGQNSAERSVDAFVAEAMPVTVGRLDSEKDPCDFLLSRGKGPFAQALEEGKEVVAFKIERVKQATGGRLDAAGALDPVVSTLGLIGDPIAREFALKQVAQLTGVSEVALQSRLRQLSQPVRRAVAKDAGLPVPQRGTKAGFCGKRDPERELLYVMLWGGECPALVRERLDPAWIGDPALLMLIRRAIELHGETGKVDAASLLAHCREERERAIVEEAVAHESDQSDGSDPSDKAGREDYGEWCAQLLARLQALHAELKNKGFGERLRAAGNYEEQKQLMNGYGKLARRAQRKIGFGKNLVS